jgi:hypothetical protein
MVAASLGTQQRGHGVDGVDNAESGGDFVGSPCTISLRRGLPTRMRGPGVRLAVEDVSRAGHVLQTGYARVISLEDRTSTTSGQRNS